MPLKSITRPSSSQNGVRLNLNILDTRITGRREERGILTLYSSIVGDKGNLTRFFNYMIVVNDERNQ